MSYLTEKVVVDYLKENLDVEFECLSLEDLISSVRSTLHLKKLNGSRDVHKMTIHGIQKLLAVQELGRFNIN